MKKYYWHHDSDPISLFSYVERVCNDIDDICERLREFDGDMYLSDLRTLFKTSYKLHQLVSHIKQEDKKNENSITTL